MRVDSPYISRAKYSRVCLRSTKETFVSTYNPSTWWNMQWARAEMASFRKTLPGKIIRMGGFVFSMILTCTEDVWVRKRTSLPSALFSMKKVSCISRAGWSGVKLRAEKLCQSSSISGPSAIVNPMRAKMSMIRLSTIDNGWRLPIG